MLRPFVLDLFDVLLPLSAGVGALVGGLYLRRMPSWFCRGVIALVVFLSCLSAAPTSRRCAIPWAISCGQSAAKRR
jgi:hypothetical protein